MRVRACVHACMGACMGACMRACMRVWPYGAVVCAVDFQLKHCGFDPRRVRFHTSFFSFSIAGWLPTAKCVCLSTCGGKKKRKKEKKKKKKKGIVTGQKPATESRVVYVRPGSSIVVVNSIRLAICSVVQFQHKAYASA